MKQNTIIFLVGPTAVGKTEAAFFVAKRIKAEIISCDSMQVYKGMDIISSQPPVSLRKKLPHHLIGYLSPGKENNVSQYRKEALKIIKDILKEGKVPLFVGGTGLYMSVLIDGIFESDARDPVLRKQLYELASVKQIRYLHERLAKVDPDSAANIHPNDTRRIIRALEVFQLTGKPISLLKKNRSGLSSEYKVRIFCLNMDREVLYERINRRVEKMFSAGLIKEVKRLQKRKLSSTASCAIGIKELKGYFDGLYDLEEVKRLMKLNTRHYAKRQLTWFKKDKRIKWIEVGGLEKPREVANKVLTRMANNRCPIRFAHGARLGSQTVLK